MLIFADNTDRYFCLFLWQAYLTLSNFCHVLFVLCAFEVIYRILSAIFINFFIHCFGIVRLVTGRASGFVNICHLSLKVVLGNKWRKKTTGEPANPCSHVKYALKWRRVVMVFLKLWRLLMWINFTFLLVSLSSYLNIYISILMSFVCAKM